VLAVPDLLEVAPDQLLVGLRHHLLLAISFSLLRDHWRSMGEVEVETWDAIRSRRNVRSYDQRSLATEDLDQILEAARRTPSAGNQQAWDFVVCTAREQLAQLATVWRGARHVAGSAATIALIAPHPEGPPA